MRYFAAFALAYGLVGLAIVDPAAVYSGDIGVKFVQARGLVATGFRSLDFPYPGFFIDPLREFFPLRPPFAMSVAGTTQAIFSPAAAALQSVLVSIAGLHGMIIGSVCAAAAVIWAAVRMAGPGERRTMALALGLGSPLWFYAITGWEHAPAIAFSTVGFASAVASRWRWSSPLAGLLVGAGAILRDEVILLLPGLLLIVALRRRTAKHVAAACLAALLPLALAAFVESAWFGRPPASHLRHAVHVAEAALRVPAAADGTIPTLKPLTLRERYEVVVQYWLLGYGHNGWIAGFSVALLVALLLRRFVIRWSAAALLVWVLAVLGLALADAWQLATAPRWLAGFQRLSPFLVFCLLPRPRQAPGEWLVPALLATSAVFVVAAFAAADTAGGKSLGPRLLLPLLPLLILASVTRINQYLAAPLRVERLIGAAGLVLVALAVLLHAAGTLPAYRSRNRSEASSLTAVRTATPRIVVTDDEFTAQLLFPLYYRKIIFLADTPSLAERLVVRLESAKVSEALVVTQRAEPLVRLDPFRLQSVKRVGRTVIQHWSR